LLAMHCKLLKTSAAPVVNLTRLVISFDRHISSSLQLITTLLLILNFSINAQDKKALSALA